MEIIIWVNGLKVVYMGMENIFGLMGVCMQVNGLEVKLQGKVGLVGFQGFCMKVSLRVVIWMVKGVIQG